MSRKKKIDRAVDDVECPVQCGCNAHVASGFFCVKIIFDNVFMKERGCLREK